MKIYLDIEVYKKKVEIVKNGKPDWEWINVPYLIGIAKNEKKVEIFFNNDKLNSFFNFLKTRETDSITFVGYNITFDINTLLPYFKNFFNSVDIEKFVDSKGTILNLVMKCDNKIFRIQDLWMWNKQRKLKDYQTESLEKQEIDYEKYEYVKRSGKYLIYENRNGSVEYSEIEKEYNYLKNDVLLLFKVEEKIKQEKKVIQKLINSNSNSKKGFSISSFTKWNINKKFSGLVQDLYRQYIDFDEYELQKNSYQGGFTSFNENVLEYECGENEEIVYLDINSMYPYIYSEYIIGDRADLDFMGEYVVYLKVKVIKIERVGYLHTSCLPYYRKNQVILISMELFQLYQEFGCVFEILEFRKYKKDHNLKEFVVKLYDMKNDFKKKGDTLNELGTKLILNSFYGKLAEQSYIQNTIEVYENGLFVKKELVDNDKHIDKFLYEDENGINYLNIYFKGLENRISGIDIAARGRIILLSSIKRLVNNNFLVLYCDTDSIIFVRRKDQDYTKILSVGDKLGEWKCVGIYQKFMNNGNAKRYLLIDFEGRTKYASGGVKVEVMEKMNRQQLLRFFSKDWNVILKRGKVSGSKNSLNQNIIDNVDFSSNSKEFKWLEVIE